MGKNTIPTHTPNPAPYPRKDHWEYAPGLVSEIVSKTPGATKPSYWADWCRTLFYGGTTLYLWNEATELKIAFLSALSLQEGQGVFLIGKYADESGLTPALKSLLGQRGQITIEEIGPQAVAAFSAVKPTPGTKLQWNFNCLDSLPDRSLDRVILFGAASHVANWNDFARQINRVLREGGRVVVAEAPLGGSEFRYAMHMDAHYEGIISRLLSGMGIKEGELPDVSVEHLTALFQPYLRWSRVFSWDGLYVFFGQKGGKEDSFYPEFPKSTKDVQAFLTVKSFSNPWDFLAEPEKAVYSSVVTELHGKEFWKVQNFGIGCLMWEWHNSRNITDVMYSNLMAKPGDKVLLICEMPEELGTIHELRKRIGETGEIVCVDMVEGAYNYKGWQEKRRGYMERGCGEEWPYEFADDYPDNYFDLIFLPQGVHHCNNWLRDAPRLLRALKPGHQIMAIEAGINRPEFHAAQRRSALLRFVGDRTFEWMIPPHFGVHPKGPVPLAPGCERVGRPHHDVSSAHLRQAFGDYLTDINGFDLKGFILFWGYKR